MRARACVCGGRVVLVCKTKDRQYNVAHKHDALNGWQYNFHVYVNIL